MNAHQDERDEQQQNGRPAYGFGLGLLTGACVGAGLALWFAPRLASELRARVTDSAKDIGQRVGDRYDQVSARLGQAADEVTRKGQDVRTTWRTRSRRGPTRSNATPRPRRPGKSRDHAR